MTPPLAPFAAQRYLEDLRDRTAGAAPDTPRELAWLWACAGLEVRCDNLLVPILVTPADLPLVETLDRLNRERDWQLPPGYFAARLERGGCILILDGVASPNPNCPSLTP